MDGIIDPKSVNDFTEPLTASCTTGGEPASKSGNIFDKVCNWKATYGKKRNKTAVISPAKIRKVTLVDMTLDSLRCFENSSTMGSKTMLKSQAKTRIKITSLNTLR